MHERVEFFVKVFFLIVLFRILSVKPPKTQNILGERRGEEKKLKLPLNVILVSWWSFSPIANILAVISELQKRQFLPSLYTSLQEITWNTH